MGMDVGTRGSSMATMNIVPLIDILLVLIIIFMVITPLTPTGLKALIPEPAKTPNLGPIAKTIVVQVLDTGKLKINEEDATWDSLGLRLSDVFKERAEKVAFVQVKTPSGSSILHVLSISCAVQELKKLG